MPGFVLATSAYTTQTHTHMHTHAHTNTHTNIHSNINAHTQVCTRAHTNKYPFSLNQIRVNCTVYRYFIVLESTNILL